jgi:hypothetical protein
LKIETRNTFHQSALFCTLSSSYQILLNMQDGQPDHHVTVPTPVFLTTASRKLDADTAIALQDIESAEMGVQGPDVASLGRIASTSLPKLAPSPRDLTTSNSAGCSSSNEHDLTQEANPQWIRHNGIETCEL